MSFFLAIVGYFLLALAYLFDKFILTKSVPNPIVFTFYSTVFLLGTLFLIPLGVEPLLGADWAVALLSGGAFGLAILAIFSALKRGEASHVNPLSGAVVTLATYGISATMFGEVLTPLQQTGVAVLVTASLLLSWQKMKGKSPGLAPLVFAVVSGVLFAISHVSAKYLYDAYPFLTGFVWSRAATGVFGLALLAYPAVRQAMKMKKKKEHAPKRHTFTLVVSGKICAVVATVLLQYAMAIGSPTLVNALSGVQFLFMFVLIFTATKLAPKIFYEYFTKKEIAVELFAIGLVLIGSACMVL